MEARYKKRQLAALYDQMTELLQKTSAEADQYDAKTRAILDAISCCMNDLQLAMVTASHEYPEFSESAYRSAQHCRVIFEDLAEKRRA